MNLGLILIIKTPFQCLHVSFKFHLQLNPKNKKYLLSCNHIENLKTPLPYCISYIIVLVYFIGLLFILFYCIVILFYLHSTPCAWQPLGGVGDARQVECFAGRLTRTKRDFLTIPQEFDINPELSLWGKFTLATTLCTWSANKVAHCLVSSPTWKSISRLK
jgi:hypothetical protein